MKRSILFLSLAFLFSYCHPAKDHAPEPKIASAATPEEPQPEKSKPDAATMVKNQQEYLTPGPEHKLMASWNGTWAGEVSLWERPDAPPVKSLSTITNKMVLGGRYQQSLFKGSYHKISFEGMGTLAFDNARKTFVSTWIDNFGTGIIVSEGPWDPASKSITFRGRMTDPSTGRQVDVKEVFKPIDDHYQVMEMYTIAPDGREFKSMEIKYTKKN